MVKLIDKLTDIDQKWIYLLLTMALMFPLVNPLGLPIKVSPLTRKFYNAIESLKPGDRVAYAFDALSMTWMEQGLSAVVVTDHLFMKQGVKVLVFTLSEEGTMFWEQVIKEIGTHGKVYGEDYVFLGYLPGMETAAAAVASDIWKAAGGKDAYGNSLENLPMMKEFHSANDVKLLVNFCRGGPEYYIRQWYTPYKVPLYVMPLSAVEATLKPFIEAGQIEAYIVGARGAAEYELLLRKPGKAISGMDAQSIGHLLLLFLIIFGNITFFLKKWGGRQK